MNEIVGYCGIVCNECSAYQATQMNDENARTKVAEAWNKQFKLNLKPDEINCDGCTIIDGRLRSYCRKCEIRKCGLSKKVLNCGYCTDYPCEILDNLHVNLPQAKAKLESFRGK